MRLVLDVASSTASKVRSSSDAGEGGGDRDHGLFNSFGTLISPVCNRDRRDFQSWPKDTRERERETFARSRLAIVSAQSHGR